MHLHQAGQLDKAERLYNAVLKKNPRNGDALNLKGAIAHTQGRFDEALTLFDRAVVALPAFADAHFNRANSLKALERNDDALAAYDKAIALDPTHAGARLNVGTLLQNIGRTPEAITAFRNMATACPADPRGHYNLGVCLTETLVSSLEDEHAAMADEAEAALKRAVTLTPNDANAHFATANLFSKRGDHDRAIQATKNAIKFNPNWPEAWSNLGSHLEANGELSEAEAAFDHALRLDPNDTGALVNKSLAQLAAGRLDKGWDGYARRFETSHALYSRRDWPWPAWQGQSLAGKTIFVWSDQGIGDEILYGSMIPGIVRAAGSCTVECAPRLEPLYRRSFPGADIVAKSSATNSNLLAKTFDYQSSVLDLGRWLRPDFFAFPNSKSYLHADSHQAARLRQLYLGDATPGTKLIGLSWRSVNPMIGGEKSLKLEQFAEILSVPDVRWINLQYGDTRKDLESIKGRYTADLISDDKIDAMSDLEALAAQISALDGVVTISNSTAHMSAALGIPTYLIIPDHKKRLWYWFGQGRFNPWYRSIRVLRGGILEIMNKILKFIKYI